MLHVFIFGVWLTGGLVMMLNWFRVGGFEVSPILLTPRLMSYLAIISAIAPYVYWGNQLTDSGESSLAIKNVGI